LAPAQTAWDQYRQQLEQMRTRQQQRYEDWRGQQETTYEKRRGSINQSGGSGFQLNLEDSSIPPGDYQVQLPFGIQARVRVQGGAAPTQNPPPPTPLGGAFYAQLDSLTRNITRDLRDIRYGVYQSKYEHLRHHVDETIAAAEQLHRRTHERAGNTQLHEQFSTFDDSWHRLVHELAQHNYLNAPWLRQEVSNITQFDNTLHQLLRVGDRPIYDRMRVAALARQLADTTKHLFEDAAHESRDNPQFEVVRRRADRVRRLASDLEEAVARGAAYSTVVEEYSEFDQSWHRLLATAQQIPEASRDLERLSRRIRAIDTELHRELKVNPPVVVTREQLQSLAESVARQADHLAEDVHRDVGDRNRDVARMADDFSAVARSLQRAVASPEDDEVNAARLTQQHWKTLEDHLQSTRSDRLEHARETASSLGRDVDRLVAMVTQKG
jgi:hypothetical protein